jgi:hypothetical protein
MLMTSPRKPSICTLRGCAIGLLHEAGAIRECEEHGWMQDRGGRHQPRQPMPDHGSARR